MVRAGAGLHLSSDRSAQVGIDRSRVLSEFSWTGGQCPRALEGVRSEELDGEQVPSADSALRPLVPLRVAQPRAPLHVAQGCSRMQETAAGSVVITLPAASQVG